MIQRDNWGWKARFGQFVVASEPVPEAEWWAMMPAGVSLHAARIKAPTPWAAWNEDRSGVSLESDLARGVAHFASMQLNVVVTGHSSSSIMGGDGWDAATIKHLEGLLAPGTIATTNGRDMLAALRATAVAKPFLVFPPWFGAATLDNGVAYFARAGFAPVGHMRPDPGRGWRDVPEAEMYPEGAGFAQDVESLYRQIRDACPDAADGVMIVGTGLRCVGLIADLEADLGRPVLTANQASLWHCLRLSGIAPSIDGYGRLFDLPMASGSRV